MLHRSTVGDILEPPESGSLEYLSDKQWGVINDEERLVRLHGGARTVMSHYRCGYRRFSEFVRTASDCVCVGKGKSTCVFFLCFFVF